MIHWQSGFRTMMLPDVHLLGRRYLHQIIAYMSGLVYLHMLLDCPLMSRDISLRRRDGPLRGR